MILIEPIKKTNMASHANKAINIFYETDKKNQFENALVISENENRT
ncbi:hypothetical protein [Peribacillus sp. R9-11]|nr:hypothetical protein [Peribacillus sp. R9-11]WMX58767.1 hypothetical protein RE409_28415 [Peribacillus sp. R9-11]